MTGTLGTLAIAVMIINMGHQGSVVFGWHLPMASSFPLDPLVIALGPCPG